MSGFGDKVRIAVAVETEALGLAGKSGVVFGFTTPSVTGVNVVGPSTDDCAINVFFDELDDSYWFAPHLVELIDHNPGLVASLDGSDIEHVRMPDGSWMSRPREE